MSDQKIGIQKISWLKSLSRPDTLFLPLAVIFGLLFSFGTAPFLVPDEFTHFYRAYQISELKLLPEVLSEYEVGGRLPQSFSLLEDAFLKMTKAPKTTVSFLKLEELLRAPLDPQKTQFYSFKISAIYSPSGYLPQAFSLLAGRILDLSLLGEFYLGRIFNLLIWILLTYTSIRTIPVFKWVMFVIGLMPMTLSQAASLSVDGSLNGLSFLFIALVIRMAYSESAKPGRLDFLVWIVTLTLITLTKPAYIVLGGLLLTIPIKKFSSRKSYVLVLILAAGIPLIAYLGWVQIASLNGITMSYDELFHPDQQTQWIMHNMVLYIKILIQNYGRMALPLLISSIGYFGWLNQPQPAFVYPLFILFAFYTVLFDHHYPNMHLFIWQRLVIIAVCLLGAIGIATGIYVVSNPVAYGQIDGIQGRYFISLEPLFCLTLYNHVVRLPGWVLNVFVPVISSFFLVIALQTVSQRIQF